MIEMGWIEYRKLPIGIAYYFTKSYLELPKYKGQEEVYAIPAKDLLVYCNLSDSRIVMGENHNGKNNR